MRSRRIPASFANARISSPTKNVRKMYPSPDHDVVAGAAFWGINVPLEKMNSKPAIIVAAMIAVKTDMIRDFGVFVDMRYSFLLLVNSV